MVVIYLFIYFRLLLFIGGSIGDKFGFTNLRSYRSKSKFDIVFKQDKCPRLYFKIFIMFKEFRCSENTDKVLSVHYFSLHHPKIMKGLMVDLSL